MRAKGKFVVTLYNLLGEPDALNHTTLRVNGRKVWPGDGDGEGNPLIVKEGDEIEISIPSGVLRGVCSTTPTPDEDDGVFTLRVEGEWSGRAGGLAGGACAIGRFEVADDALVETSAYHEPVPYWLYEKVREIANFGVGGPRERKRLRMRKIFRVVLPKPGLKS